MSSGEYNMAELSRRGCNGCWKMRETRELVSADRAAVIAADPAHWDVATSALIRAVAFDGLTIDHPAVRTLLEALAPVTEAEFAYREAADAWFSLAPSDR